MTKTEKTKEKKDKSKSKTLVLLDSHAIIHRGYHALPDFATSKGVPTGALYGLSSMLIGIIEKFNPDYIVACYDLPQPTYRHEAYKDYKAGRKKSDGELVEQIKLSRKIFENFNIPAYDKAGFEADDMLGTIVEQTKDNHNLKIIIASGDMDTLQLVRDKEVQVFTLKKGIKDTVTYDEDAVVERFGFLPKYLPDYKGLRGDPSDNIIGISGIGEKTATTLISHFKTVENIYKTLNKGKTGERDEKGIAEIKKLGITDRIIDLLVNGEDEAIFSKMLATIRRDAPIKFELPEQAWKESFDIKKAQQVFDEFEFRVLGARLNNIIERNNGTQVEGQVSGQSNGVVVVSKKKADLIVEKEEEEEGITEEQKKKVCIALWVLNSSLTNPSYDDVMRYSKSKKYADIEKYLLSEIEKQGLTKVLKDIEWPLIPVVEKMEEDGILIDKKYLKKLSEDYHVELARLEKEIWEMAGREFNVDSPKQLGVVIFEEMNLGEGLGAKRLKKTASGARSTKESELEKMKGVHPIIDKILEYRELAKLLSTYIDPLPKLTDSKDRLHAKFLQAGTTTGRMSSQSPNLQNIPIKTELGRRVRGGFIAEKGHVLLSFDYSQIELRIAAIMTEDKNLIDIFKKGHDVHTGVASKVFGVEESEVTKEMRRKAKVINFGILYGMGVNALKTNLGGTKEEAQTFYNEYFKTFVGVAEFIENTKKFAEQNGYTETLFGRRRYFEGIRSKLPFIRAAAERMAINAPLQGTSADIIKIAMRNVYDLINDSKNKEIFGKVKMLLQVHDELVFEVEDNKEFIKKVSKKIQDHMQDILSDSQSKGVPLVTSANIGMNWGEMSAIEDFINDSK
ncbi:MAG: DNA polymerase [bacterium]